MEIKFFDLKDVCGFRKIIYCGHPKGGMRYCTEDNCPYAKSAAIGAQPATEAAAERQPCNSAMDAIAALRELYDACILADADGELSEHINGSILDRAKDVLKLHQ